MSDDRHYRVYCNHCEEKIAGGTTINNTMENFFWNLTKHNAEYIEDRICEDAKDEIEARDLESAFSRGDYEIQVGEKTEEREWKPLK